MAPACQVFSAACQASSAQTSTDLKGPIPGEKSSTTVGLKRPVLMLRRELCGNSIYPTATSASLMASCALLSSNLNAAEGLTSTPTERTASPLPAGIARLGAIASSAAAAILVARHTLPIL